MPNELLREQNIELVLQTTYKLFLENGIDNTNKKMIIEASGISRSSLDRYFATKTDLVLATAGWAEKNVRNKSEKLNDCLNDKYTGYEKIKIYLEALKSILEDEPRLFVLAAECRAFLYRDSKNAHQGSIELNNIMGSSWFLKRILEQGVKDGSLNEDIDIADESVMLREAYIGFLASIALANKDKRELTDKYIKRILNLYKKI